MSRSAISRSVVALLALWAGACRGEPTASPGVTGMDRETFIATYVDLRTAVIRGDAHELSDADRARILAEHGVTEEEILAFPRVHGDDVAFMRGVWDEVESRLDAIRLDEVGPEPDPDGRR